MDLKLKDGRFLEIRQRFDKDLEHIAILDDNRVAGIKQCLEICNRSVQEVNLLLSDLQFEDSESEIYFFKVFKPYFISRQVYYSFLLRFEIQIPSVDAVEQSKFRVSEIAKIVSFLNEHVDFYHYCKGGASYLDKILFRRSQAHAIEMFPFFAVDLNDRLTTKYDLLLAKIIGYEQLLKVLKPPENSATKDFTTNPSVDFQINWSTTKVALAELLYALHSIGALSHTPIEIQTLSEIADKVFNVRIGNIYKVFEEIRIRKKNRTAFIDHLKNSLIQRMELDDDRNLN